MPIIRIIVFCTGFLLIANSANLAFAKVKNGIISDAIFYFSVIGSDGTVRKFERNVVPNIPKNVCYGWRLKLKNASNIVKFTEEFSLPSEPNYWPNEDDSYATNTVSKDRKSSLTQKFVTPKHGWIENGWCIVEGDPLGIYKMKIFISDVFVYEFEFEVLTLDNFRKRRTENQ